MAILLNSGAFLSTYASIGPLPYPKTEGSQLDITQGIFVLVEPADNGKPGYQIVITDDGKRHIFPEILEFEEEVKMAEEARNLARLPENYAWITREAMVASSKRSRTARKALKIVDKQMAKER